MQFEVTDVELRALAELLYTEIRNDHGLREGFNLPWSEVSEEHAERFENAILDSVHAAAGAG